MEWQFFTTLATIAASYYMIRKDIKTDMLQMQTFHREDMKSMREDMNRMDEKWERLFEKLLLKEQK